jgi:hypothetical protein
MHRSGHLTIIKTTLAAMPVYTAISHALPPWVIKAFMKIFRGFLRSGSEVAHGSECLATWDQVQIPLSLGGLGVKDLRLMGHALRLRWLWQQCSNRSKPWMPMPVSEDEAMWAFFRASVVVTMGNGTSMLFWEEHWLNGQGIKELAPDLVTTVPAKHQYKRTM